MAERNVLVVDTPASPWADLLKEFFEDTASSLSHCENMALTGRALERIRPDVVFIHPSLLSLTLAQKFNVLRARSPEFRIFALDASLPKTAHFTFDHVFQEMNSMIDFQKEITNALPFPDLIYLLVVDDEPEIGVMFKDYLEGRKKPDFTVDYARDGVQGLQKIARKRPDILLLDIKMPVKDGREVYHELVKQNLKIPVIIYFDAIVGSEVEEIHKIGRPAIVDKGSGQSSPSQMLSLIKKMYYFG